MEASISLKNVSKQYGLRKALKQVSFGVEKNTIFCLVGPSGAGKTTLLNVLTTLVRPDDGTIYIHGLNLKTRAAKIRAFTGYVPESNTLNPVSTIFENLRIHGILNGLPGDKASTRAMRQLDRFEMIDHAHDLPPELSYGMQRRALVARALVSQPEILYLDEPTANVDYPTRRLIWKVLNEWRDRATIFVTSRDIQEVEQHADRIMILADGDIIMDGAPESLRTDSARPVEYMLRFKSENVQYRKVLESAEAVKALEQNGRTFTLQLQDGYGLETVLRNFNDEQIEQFTVTKPSLNEIIMDLIHKKLALD
ncbi:MAG: putative multidrug ABC transporter ATP-binding protein YbhF [Candidatus Marinimicrobia bacterium]|nr:putative multidrug ABC transporter ATP-binding protein YbhF [Candidatus Neomarinimicrobiota bacterium]